MIQVFATDIENQISAKEVVAVLKEWLPDAKVTIDGSDEENVLRIEHIFFRTADIHGWLYFLGHTCKEMTW